MDTSTWQVVFFWLTMVTVFVMNVCAGLFQNCIYGLAALLPMKYINALVMGTSISGIIASLLNIATAGLPNLRTSAIFYFLAAIFILQVAYNAYFSLPLFKFFRYHAAKPWTKPEELITFIEVENIEEKNELCNEFEKENLKVDFKKEEPNLNERPPYLHVFKQCWISCIGIFTVMFVTLSTFPALSSSVKRLDTNFWISENYFISIGCFLFFNIFCFLGNLSTGIYKIPVKFIMIPIVLRSFFIVFFLFCNARPDNARSLNIPVLINSDHLYILGIILLSWSSGYFASLCMMYCPEYVENKYKGLAGMLSSVFLMTGVLCGVLFSFVLSYSVKL